MLTKNIEFKNFDHKTKNIKIKKIFQNIKNNVLNEKDKLLFSLSEKYKFSFNFIKLKKYKKFNSYKVIGMGGSSLGAEAIYSFLKFKVKKNFFF